MSIEHLLSKVHNCDCLEFMKQLPDKCVDLVLTSPPYNKNGYRGGKRDCSKGVGRWGGADIKYDNYDDDMDEDKYRQWQIEVLNEGFRILKDKGSFIYNHKVRRWEGKASHPLEWVLKSNMNFYQEIIWDRGSGPDHNINYLDPTSEVILWLCKDKPLCNKNPDYATEVWRFPPDSNNAHPAPFPLTMAYVPINMTTNEGGIVYDPFMGSGTVAVACERLDRKWIGTELSPKYCEIANKRIEAERAQLKLF